MNLNRCDPRQLKPHPDNYNEHPPEQIEHLVHSLQDFDQVKNIVVWKGFILAGHGLVEAALAANRPEIEYQDVSDWPEDKAKAFLFVDNEVTRLARPDYARLHALIGEAKARGQPLHGITPERLEEIAAEARALANKTKAGTDTEPQIDKAAELQEKWQVQPGDVWELGPHRLICGDCTDPAVVERVTQGERATLCHADPPYGMGKEKDGIANDNLYRDKLDAFQMQWWGVARRFVEDNGSAYIWGNAEDLWRLWYIGGLRDSERLTLRNEIVWDKQHGQGMGADDFRSYAPATERCLFFMLGEQGFNNNADNYWEGWEPIRKYLKDERDKMGWDIPTCKTLAGHSPTSGCHWFDASQWSFVTEDVYNAWQTAANGQAFKREYDDLKREFYATRAYFDNTHDNMTDVWQFPRVQGEERWGHATPKPVPMIERIVKSSAPAGAIVYSPFLGSGPDLIACENLGRRCRGIELAPEYVAVTLQRFLDHTGREPVKVQGL